MGYLQFDAIQEHKLFEKHAAALGIPEVKVSWVIFNGPDAMNTALLSDSIDIVSGGIPGLVTFWARTAGTSQEVRGVSALSTQPILLNTRKPALKTIADLTAADRIAVPSVKVSIQAVILQMAAAKLYGKANYTKLDDLTVAMSPPDATIALLSGNSEVNCAFTAPGYQEPQLKKEGIHNLLNSFDVAGPHSFSLAWAKAKFRNENPLLYKALMLSLREATDMVNADKRAAVATWIEHNKSKLPLDTAAEIASGPQVNWTMAPQATLAFARFMNEVGSTKRVPDSWKDMFFPELHDLAGS
jgi:NitT/TauT family transport system substrate-binding protein